MDNDKPEAWNMDASSENAGHYKDIVPGDQINQEALLNEAYEKAGEAMAQDSARDQYLKENEVQLRNSMLPATYQGQTNPSTWWSDHLFLWVTGWANPRASRKHTVVSIIFDTVFLVATIVLLFKTFF